MTVSALFFTTGEFTFQVAALYWIVLRMSSEDRKTANAAFCFTKFDSMIGLESKGTTNRLSLIGWQAQSQAVGMLALV